MRTNSKTPFMKIALVFVLLSVVSGVSAQTAPGPSGQNNEPFVFTNVEFSLLEQCNLLDQRFEKEGVVYTDQALNAYLEQIGQTLIPAGDAPEHVRWRFRVLRDPLENAFAMPNGSIYLHSGILSLLENESQVATVIAHEIAHVLHRHTYKENRNLRKKALAFTVLGAAAGSVPGFGLTATIIRTAASTAQVFLLLSTYHYSRELEREADLFATRRLLDSNYAPQEMLATFRLLGRDFDLEQITAFYSDHPKLQERIAYVEQLLKTNPPSAMSAEILAASQTRYLTMTEKITRHDIHLNLDHRRYRTALARSHKLVNFNPKSSENVCYLAESYRSLGPKTTAPTAEELAPDARKKALKMKSKLTPEEAEKNQLATPLGQSNWKNNQAQSEEQYRKALELDAGNATAHRGLGMLYERMEKPQEALAEYRTYLELKPDALDRVIIQRRLDALHRAAKP